ncbi:ATP-binding protein [Streptomyces sp. NPDC058274]|jgi:anti-sigma regulatory factor (Ser/Thr protein kinase)|uniref:ATP-binding protein n=1 Tax=Streptomyces sp. NPDC058274 TaxID=3346416 RepID=UPI0036E152F3
MCGKHRTHSTDTAALPERSRSRGPRSPAEARQAVRHALEGRFRGRGGPGDDDVVGDALLVASELTTNAILHGGGVTDFEVTLLDRELMLSVSDRSDQLPLTVRRLDERGRMRVGGHGWPIICRLARDIVVSTLHNGGKRITAVVPLSAA